MAQKDKAKREDMEDLIYCEYCKTETPHRHLYNAAYGLSQTYMTGSERFECSKCKNTIHYGDNPKLDSKSVLETEARK